MKIIVLIVSTITVIGNLLLLFCVHNFSKEKTDKYSKVGFGFMKVLCVINTVLIAGGVLNYVI